jgi:hypothetical protein
MRERTLRGELYIADDAENEAEFERVQELLAEFNGSSPGAWDERDRLLTIGAACQIATKVQLLTATHPIDPEPRRIGWEYAKPITLADNVWLGGGVIVCPA